MQTTATIQQLNEALNHVNEMYENNIVFKREPHQISAQRTAFTVTVRDSAGPGGRISHTGRRVSAACWHVHGHFFEYLFNECDVTLIIAGKRRMYCNLENWQDWNIGSYFSPMMYSEACNC